MTDASQHARRAIDIAVIVSLVGTVAVGSYAIGRVETKQDNQGDEIDRQGAAIDRIADTLRDIDRKVAILIDERNRE